MKRKLGRPSQGGGERLHLMINPKLMRAIRIAAAKESRSLSSMVGVLLAKAMSNKSGA